MDRSQLWLNAFDEVIADGFTSLQAQFYADAVVRTGNPAA
jgi:hypothetical protein